MNPFYIDIPYLGRVQGIAYLQLPYMLSNISEHVLFFLPLYIDLLCFYELVRNYFIYKINKMIIFLYKTFDILFHAKYSK